MRIGNDKSGITLVFSVDVCSNSGEASFGGDWIDSFWWDCFNKFSGKQKKILIKWEKVQFSIIPGGSLNVST